jgi:integrase/recombinase XerD
VRYDLLPVDNPISRVDRASVQGYSQARALAPLSVAEALRKIDRRGMIGKRDYALLRFGLSTGARINAIAQLRMGDLDRGEPLTFTVRRDKGGKSWGRTLDAAASKALRAYLTTLYGDDLEANDDAPVWISFCRSRPGQPLGHKAIREVCLRWLGTTKAHTLRHTFAGTLNEIGAKVTDIQGLLNHASLGTTSTYLRALTGNVNPYGEQVGAMYGLEE